MAPKESYSVRQSLDLPFSSLGMGSSDKGTQLPDPPSLQKRTEDTDILGWKWGLNETGVMT